MMAEADREKQRQSTRQIATAARESSTAETTPAKKQQPSRSAQGASSQLPVGSILCTSLLSVANSKKVNRHQHRNDMSHLLQYTK